MINAQEAKRRAAEFLQSEGSPWVVSRAKLDRRFRVWVISYVDPQEPEQALDGGALVVTEDGVVDHLGSAPGSLEELMGELGRLPVDPLAEAWAREGEGLALLVDSDPAEAEGLAAWAAGQQQRREGSEKWGSDLGEDLLPASWSTQLAGELEQDYWSQLLTFVAAERQEYEVFPPADQTFSAFDFTSYEDVKVVILGQDPYPTPGEAHGLAFSVPDGVGIPRSLRNIFKELESDLEVTPPSQGNLEGWARQGVLLLNTTLTLRAGGDAKYVHRKWRWRGKGWQTFTDAVISAVSAKQELVVFILWGVDAKAKEPLIDESRHVILKGTHPSPQGANQGGFFGTRPFSKANRALAEAGRGEIDWAAFRASR